MSRKTGFRRRWGGWRPSRAQQRILDALAQGSTNAAIAAQLSISPETVKWHVSELLAETGLSDRRELASWWTSEREDRDRAVALPALFSLRPGLLPAVALAAVIALVVTAVFLLVQRSGSDDQDQPAGLDMGSDPAVESLIETAESPGTCEPPEQLDLGIVPPQQLVGEGLVRIGQLITPLHCPVYAANRIDRAFAWLGGEGVVEFEGLEGWQFQGASDVGLGFQQGLPSPDHQLLEVIAVGLNSRLAERGFNVDETRGVAVTRRTHGEGAYLLVAMQDSGFHRVALASTGELFVDPRPAEADLVVNQETGERIDISRMREVGRLPVEERPTTECRGGGPCLVRAIVRNAGLPAPVEGRLVCPAEGSLVPATRDFELDSGEFVLAFRSIDPNATGPPRSGVRPVTTPASTPDDWVCEESDLAAGDRLPVHEDLAILEVSARAPDGSPLSAVAAYDGTLYVGTVTLSHPCGMLEFC
jgi:DNA-binding CsgD family transcriptional regulator